MKADIESVRSIFESVRSDSSDRVDQCSKFLSLYSGVEFDSEFNQNFHFFSRLEGDISTYNALAQITDTLISKIGKNKPRVRILPSGGDYSIQETTELLEKFISGVFQSTKLYEFSRKETLLSALLFGTGVWKVYHKEGNIKIENILPYQLYIDKKEAKKKEIKQIFQTSFVGKDQLLEDYPDKAKEIEFLTADSNYSNSLSNSLTNNETGYEELEVVEYWKVGKKNKKGINKGIHIAFCQDVELLSEEYTRDTLPFVFIRWQDIPSTFWGQGVAEKITPLQMKLNNISLTIDKGLDWALGFFVVEDQEGSFEVTNLDKAVYPKAPVYNKIEPIPSQLFQERQETYTKCFELVGVSQLSAIAKKPSGLDAAVALQEFQDIETERFASQALSWEESFMSIAEQVIDCAKEISSSDNYEELKVTMEGDKFFETVEWNEIDLDEEQYIISLMPASMFPTTPAGRLQKISSMMEGGLLSPAEGRALILQTPDLERFADLSTSIEDIMKKSIDKIARTGESFTLESFDNKQFALSYAVKVYSKARLDEAPEQNLEALRQFIMTIISEQEAKAAQAQIQQAAQAPVQTQAPAAAPGNINPAGRA